MKEKHSIKDLIKLHDSARLLKVGLMIANELHTLNTTATEIKKQLDKKNG